MPTYQITDQSTGKKYKITGDRPPTQQEVEELIASTKPAKKEPDFYEVPDFDSPSGVVPQPKQKKDTSIGDKLLGAGEAALTTVTGTLAGAPAMIAGTVEGIGKSIAEGKFGTPQGAREAQETAMRRAGQVTYTPRTETGQDYVETIGKVTEALPVVPVLAPEAAAIRSSLQGVKTIAPAMTNRARAQIKSLIARERPEVQVFTSEGKLTPDAMRVISQSDLEKQIKGLLTPEEAERYNLFKSRGIEPTRADISRSVSDQRELREALKEEGPVVDAVAEQERGIRRVIENEADRLDENVGGSALTRDVIGSRIFESINDFTSKSDDAVNAAYDAARVQGRADGRVVIAGDLAQTVISQKKSDTSLGGLVSRAENILEEQGVIKENDQGKMIITNKRLTVDEAEEIRKLLNAEYRAAKLGPEGGQQRAFITNLKNKIDSDVERAVGADIFADARKQKKDFEKVIERDRRDKRDVAGRELLRNIIENKIPEDKIVDRLLSADKNSFKQVKDFLLSENGGEKGARAFNNLKSFILRDLLDRSLNKRTLVGGEPEFNPVKLGDAVAKLKERGIYNELFTPEEQKLISDVIQIGKIRTPDNLVRSGRGPSSFAITALMRSPLITKFPLLGDYVKDVADAYAARRRDARLLDPVSGLETAVQRAASRQQGQAAP
jgi:hypothetical protein